MGGFGALRMCVCGFNPRGMGCLAIRTRFACWPGHQKAGEPDAGQCLTSKHWLNAGTASATLAQHWASVWQLGSFSWSLQVSVLGQSGQMRLPLVFYTGRSCQWRWWYLILYLYLLCHVWDSVLWKGFVKSLLFTASMKILFMDDANEGIGKILIEKILYL